MDGLTAEEFYRRRDDRTDRITTNHEYHRLPVRVIAAAETTRTFSGQVQLLVAANLLARWCRQVEFGFPDAPLANQLRIGVATSLHARITREVDQADPFGKFAFEAIRTPNTGYVLKVGGLPAGEPVDFTINADGWDVYAGVGDRVPDLAGNNENPTGPSFAACVGAADAFKVATGQEAAVRVRNLGLCLFDLRRLNGSGSSADLPAMPRQLALGTAQIIGLGSVGSAAIYLLRMTKIEGDLWLIDHDNVEVENLNRSPLFGVADLGSLKVNVAERYLRDAVSIKSFPGRYDQFVENHGRKPGDVDLVLPFANEFGVRAVIEHNFPPIQVYGTTAASGAINFHRHIPLVDDCSLCRFPISDEPEAALMCSVGTVQTTAGKQIDAALPFVSTAAASLALAHLIRLQSLEYPVTPNFAYIDLLGPLETIASYRRTPRPSCQCQSRNRRIHADYIRATQFANVPDR
jgi:hypothetical protein